MPAWSTRFPARARGCQAGRRRWSAPTRMAQPSSPWRSTSTPWPLRVSGWVARSIELVRVDRPRGHLSVDETIADLAALARPLAEPLRRQSGVRRCRRRGGRHRPPTGRTGAARAQPRVARRGHRRAAGRGARADAHRSRSPTRPISAGSPSIAAGPPSHADTLLYITGEVGVGGNVVIDGRTLEGAAGYAGEVGHIPVNPNGIPCACGSIGCWETEVGERALLLRAGRDPNGGRAAVDASHRSRPRRRAAWRSTPWSTLGRGSAPASPAW